MPFDAARRRVRKSRVGLTIGKLLTEVYVTLSLVDVHDNSSKEEI
jgi:hypothetical protein